MICAPLNSQCTKLYDQPKIITNRICKLSTKHGHYLWIEDIINYFVEDICQITCN